MDDPPRFLGHLDYQRGDGVEEIEFYYPSGINWSCLQCGNCCGDVDERERLIRLLREDIVRVKEVSTLGFYEEWDEDKFVALMLKNHGKCVFYNDGCLIYENKPLLCRIYPFWLAKQDNLFVFGVDEDCTGLGTGDPLDESFFKKLLNTALQSMNH